MNILWISHNVPYPPRGGVLQRNYNLLKEVSSRHNVFLVAFIQRALLPSNDDIDEARQRLEKLCIHVEFISIPSERSLLHWYWLLLRNLFSRNPYDANWLKSKEMHSTITALCNKHTFNLVHYDTIGLAEYFTDTGTACKVLNHHNVESAMMRRRCGLEPHLLKKLYFYIEAYKLRRYEQYYCRQFHLNIAVSQLDKEGICAHTSGINAEVISNGVDIHYFSNREGNPISNTIIFVGGMSWYPNRDAILYFCQEVWPLLKKELPLIKFTIVGKSIPYQITMLAAKDSNVEIAGFVPDVRPYLSKASVFICPIRQGGGTRLKILDALAMGKAIVSTSIGCEGLDVIPDTHILIANTPQDWVCQIKRVFSDQGLRKRLEYSGRQLVERVYSWGIIGNRLNEVHEALIQP